MIRFVTQGILVSFLLFFYCAPVSSEDIVNQPIQLVVETDRNQLYQDSQLLVTLHIFHEEPLPESVDIIPPQLEIGRVRTLGLPYTRVEQGISDYSYHTTQTYALFPDNVGNLTSTGPSIRFPSPFNNESQTITAEIPSVNVIAKPDGVAWLPSENLVLTDNTVALDNAELGHIRRVSITAVATLPHQLPDRILDPIDRQDYRLVDRFMDEFHSRQGVTSQLQELWLVTSTPNTSTSQPVSSIVWWDTENQILRQTQAPVPAIAINELSKQTVITEDTPVVSESLLETPPENPSQVQTSTPFWLQVAIGFTLLTVVSLAILAGFKFQLGRKSENTSKSASKRGRIQQTDQPSPIQRAGKLTNPEQNKPTPSTNSLTANAELQAFQSLSKACQQNACHQARTALVLWAACFWPDKRITHTESIYQANVSQTLNYLLLDLEHHIKQSQEGAWRGDLLLEAVKALRRRGLK